MAQGDSAVTDDAMMLETAFGEQVRVIEGSYQNLKITTPEDIMTAELYLNRKSEKKVLTLVEADGNIISALI